MTLRFLIFVSFFLLSRTLFVLGQTSYIGTVGSAPVEMVIEATEDGPVQGVYVYTKFDTPISLSGSLRNGKLVLTEKNDLGKPSATLTLPAFSAKAQTASGMWKNLATGQSLALTLTQQSAVEPGKASEGTGRELLQAATLRNTYFRVVLTSAESIGAVKLFEKKTDWLLQTIPVECQLRGMNTVSVGDFNFDGFPDFAVFEQGYAGPNTSSLYFLYNPATKRYFKSSYSGVSLEFDAKAKRIYETNSCCAGSSVQKFIYKVVNNRMVLVAQHCYKWDEKKEELVERKLSACQ
jgi:hypothetical protein